MWTYNAGQKSWDTYQNTSEQSPPPFPPFPSPHQTHIYTRKTIYLHLSTLYWRGGGGEGGDCAQIVSLNDYLVFFWTIFTSVPTTFNLHCLKVTI